jgi:hypothetical protein
VRRWAILALFLVALGLVGVIVDLVARSFVEGRVEDEFADGTRIRVEDADFSIDSFPFLGRLAAFGEVSATLHLEGIMEQGVAIDAFDLEVDGLVFDRGSAFNGDVEVTGLDRATTSLTLTEATIGELVGTPVAISADGTVSAAGVTAQAVMEGDDLVLTGAGVRAVVPVRLPRYLPCDPAVEPADGSVTLSCTTEELPPVVNQVIGEVTGR